MIDINLKIGAKAVLLLKVILRFFEAVSALPGGEGAQARSKARISWDPSVADDPSCIQLWIIQVPSGKLT